jgi:hypothetical protein
VPSEALAEEGNPAPLNVPKGFCPSDCPPSVEIFVSLMAALHPARTIL